MEPLGWERVDKNTDRGLFLFCADINFNGVRKKVSIYTNDDIELVAKKFAEENGLNPKMLEKLVQTLKEKQGLVLSEFRL